MASSRRFLGATRGALRTLGAVAMFMPRWYARRPGSPAARRIETGYFRWIVRGAGVRVERRGTPAPGAGTLYVANHISWVDIPLLASLIDADFVSKTDVARWPLVGPLARRFGTLFVTRERRGGTAAQAEAIARRLQGGQGIILFPEGTTAGGLRLLPFRTSLFAAAASAARVQPVAISYAAPDGGPMAPDHLADVAWERKESVVANAVAIARRRTRAVVTFLPPLDPAAYADRKALALAAYHAIAGAGDAAPRRRSDVQP